MRKLIIFSISFLTLIGDVALSQEPIQFDDYRSRSIHLESFVEDYELKLQKLKSKSDSTSNRNLTKQSKLFYRWVWLNQNRLDKNGFTVNTLAKSLEALEKVKSIESTARSLPGGDWINVGPTDVFSNTPSTQLGLGRVNCLAFDDLNGYVFAGSAAGGVWKKPITGGTWNCITNSIPNLGVSGICLNPTNANDIFLLTGDGDGNSESSIGVIRTLDGGSSWNTTGLNWSEEIGIKGFKLIRNPSNPDILIAVTSNGIYKTSNAGVLWNLTISGQFYDIEFKPGQPSTVYAASNDGFWLSNSTGDSWSQISIPGLAGMGAERCAIAVSPSEPGSVYFAAGKQSTLPGFVGIWKSIFSGSTGTWGSGPLSSASSTADVFIDGSNSYSQAVYDFAFAVNPSSPNEIFIGGIDTYRSANGGITFNRESSYYQAGNDNMHADQHAFEYDDFGNLWVGNDAGVFRYTPSNITSKWTQEFVGLAITQYYGIGLDRDANLFGNFEANFLGAQDNGQHRFDGDANNEIVYFGDGGDAVVDYTNDNTYYYNQNALLIKSCFPLPCNKTPPTSSCGCTDASYNITGIFPDRPIVIDPSNHNIIYHGIGCLWISNNAADNWSLYPGFDCSVGGLIQSIQIGTGYKWVCKSTKVFRETSSGVWSDFTSNLTSILNANTGLRLTDLAVNPSNPLEAWVSFSGYEAAYKVYYTSNGGSSWVDWGIGIPDVPVNCLIYQNGTNGGLYAGTDLGVYYTNNTLPDFVPFTNGMPAVRITDLEINPTQGLLYATTYGRGLWTSSLAGPCPANENTNNFASLPGASLLQASNSITSSQIYNSGLGQNLEFQAGNFVQLNPGFEVALGTELTASIATCTNIARTVANYNDGVLILNSKSLSPGQNNFIGNEKGSTSIQMSPNPASEQMVLHISNIQDGQLEISIIDISGRIILKFYREDSIKEGSYRIPLNISMLDQGTYFLEFKSNGIATSKTFIKL